MRNLWVGLALVIAPATAEPGLRFEQVENPAANRPAPRAKVTVQPLSVTDFHSLLARLPRLPKGLADLPVALLRGDSLPAPQVTKVVDLPFPPPVKPEPPPSLLVGPPEVERFGPTGEVDPSAQVHLSFHQPVAERRTVTVRLMPPVAGQWRWVGTQGLIFQPQTRLPMATSFRVEVQGANPTSWTFETPPPVLKTSYPTGGKVRKNPVIFLGFNQRVEPGQVLSRLQFSGPALRQATPQEIESDESQRAKWGRGWRWCPDKPSIRRHFTR
ncbi:hypothetical protein IV102_20965 [bacterium]|nr:hypothetical protein [bacterium]